VRELWATLQVRLPKVSRKQTRVNLELTNDVGIARLVLEHKVGLVGVVEFDKFVLGKEHTTKLGAAVLSLALLLLKDVQVPKMSIKRWDKTTCGGISIREVLLNVEVVSIGVRKGCRGGALEVLLADTNCITCQFDIISENTEEPDLSLHDHVKDVGEAQLREGSRDIGNP